MPFSGVVSDEDDVSLERYENFSLESVKRAKAWLNAYTDLLNTRFDYGGDHIVSKLPSGEEFTEIVSGGQFTGLIPFRCYSAFSAVQTFIDAVEKYIGLREWGKIYWRSRPNLMYLGDERDTLVIYTTRCRVLII